MKRISKNIIAFGGLGAVLMVAALALADNGTTDAGRIFAAIEAREVRTGYKLVVPGADSSVNASPNVFSVSNTVDGGGPPLPDGRPLRLKITTNFYLTSPTVDKRVFIDHPRGSYTFSTHLQSVGGKAVRRGSPAAFRNQTMERNGRWWLLYDNSTDAIAYNQAASDQDTVELKEWIYARRPNSASGSRYDWTFGAMGRRVRLSDMGEGRVGLHEEMLVSGLDNNNEAERQRIINVVHTALPGFYIDQSPLTAVLEPVVYWTADGQKRQGRYEITDRNTLGITIDEPARNYPLLIDPTLSYGKFLGANNGDTYDINTLAFESANSELYVGGTADGPFSAGTVQSGTFSGSTEGFVIEVADTTPPVMNWLQWFGGTGPDQVLALAVNGDEIYVGGKSIGGTSWETLGTVSGTYDATNGLNDAWVVEVADGATPSLTWMQWLGGPGGETLSTLAVNGDEIYAGGYSSNVTDTWGTIGSSNGTYGASTRAEGWVVEIADGVSPTVNWIQWLGGSGTDQLVALAVNGDEIYAGGHSNSSVTDWDTAASTAGTYTASTEGWVVEIGDGSPPTLNWRQWLGGTDIDQVTALAVNGDEIYAGGRTYSSTSWETIGSGAGTFGGTNEGFVVEIADGSPPTVPWRQWLGGGGLDQITALAVNGDEIYVGGNTNSTASWDTVGTTYGTYTLLVEDWIVEIADGGPPTVNWFQWLGGTGNDDITALVVNGDEIFAGGDSTLSASWDTVGTAYGTYTAGQEGWLIKIIDDSATAVDVAWLQWLGGSGNDQVNALAINGDEIYAGGVSTSVTSWQTAATVAGTFNDGSQEGFVVEVADGSPPTVNWLQWLGGSGTDQVLALAVNGDEVYAGGFSFAITSWETVGVSAGTYSGSKEAFVVEIEDAATPTVGWLQWFGNINSNSINALAVNGDEIYAAGELVGQTQLETVGTVYGTYGGSLFDEGFVLHITDGSPPTIDWQQWIGTAGNEAISSLAINGQELYAAGNTDSSGGMETLGSTAGTYTNGLEGFVVELNTSTPGTINWMQWLGGTAGDDVNALAVNGDEVYAGGFSSSFTSWETVGSTAGTYNAGTEGFVVEITDAGPPTVAWRQWLGGSSTDNVLALAVNGDEIYASGYSNSSTSWETVGSISGTFTAGDEAWVAEITDAGPPTVAWVHWLGGSANDQGFALAVNGEEIYAGGFASSFTSWETVGSTAGTYNGGNEGFLVELKDSSSTSFNVPWLQWLGDYGGDTTVRGLAVTGDEIYAGGDAAAVSAANSIATVAGTFNPGATEGFVLEIADGASPAINWLQWLGGDGGEFLFALAVNGDEIYAGGDVFNSSSFETAGSMAGTFNAGGLSEGFVAEIADGSSPTVAWIQWLGGSDSDVVRAVAVNGDEIYAGGESNSVTSWETVGSTAGTFNSGGDGFVAEIADGGPPTVAWVQWLGGSDTDQVWALAVNGDEIYAGGNTSSFTSWETVGSTAGTFNAGGLQEGFVVEIADAGPPTVAWRQWVGGDDADWLYALAVNGDEVYAGGATTTSISWETAGSTVGTFNVVGIADQEGFVVEIADAGPPTMAWRMWLGGDNADAVYALAVNGDEIYAGGYSAISTSWETVGSTFGSFTDELSWDGWIVEIADGGPPTVAWRQWLGGDGLDQVTALAINGDEVYAGGTLSSEGSWEVTAPSPLGKIFSFIVEEDDDGTLSSGADTIFFDGQF
jgi:hypothetical protein